MTRIPSKSEILDWIAENPTQTAKRDIARAFGIKGAARIDLKRVLRELEDEGRLTKRKSSYRDPDKLPPVSVLEVTGADADGDLFARPMEWAGDGPVPRILLNLRASDPALGTGDRILGRLTEVKGEDHAYEARLIRRIGTNPLRILGVYRAGSEGGRILPVDKGTDRDKGPMAEIDHATKRGISPLPAYCARRNGTSRRRWLGKFDAGKQVQVEPPLLRPIDVIHRFCPEEGTLALALTLWCWII